MSVDDEYEIHPLDRDYSDDGLPKSRRKPQIQRKLPYDPKMRFNGVITFLFGYTTLVISAIVMTRSRGFTTSETVSSVTHKIGMYIMLFGAILVMAAYRSDQSKR